MQYYHLPPNLEVSCDTFLTTLYVMIDGYCKSEYAQALRPWGVKHGIYP